MSRASTRPADLPWTGSANTSPPDASRERNPAKGKIDNKVAVVAWPVANIASIGVLVRLAAAFDSHATAHSEPQLHQGSTVNYQ
jgi:hypothetical protein